MTGLSDGGYITAWWTGGSGYKMQRYDSDGSPLGSVVLSGDNSTTSSIISGIATFDYSNNNGDYSIGEGDYTFVTDWSKASGTSIYAYDSSEII